jgi:molecular chaperone GrpE
MADEKSEDLKGDFELVREEGEGVLKHGKLEEAVVKLREKLKACEGERQEYLYGWQRARADLINERKELEKQKTEFLKFANADLILQVLPVIDSFEMAMKETMWTAADKNWQDGMLNVYNQLSAVLKDNNVESLNPEGELFDPNYHDSIEAVETENKDEDGRILEVMQKGYMMHGQIIRPARVRVGQYKHA